MEKLVYTGYAGGDKNKPIKLFVTYDISQSIANNQSTITCGMYIKSPSSSYPIGPWKDYGSYLPTTNSTFTHNLPEFKGSHTITSGRTMTVNHDSAGNATATIYWKSGYSSSWAKYQKPSGSFNITLPQIPRQANLTSAPDFTDEGNPTVNYNNPAGTAVDELVCGIYNDAGSVAYAAYRDVSKTGTSYTFNLTDAERDALRQACTGNSMTVRFYLKTKIGGTYYYSSIAKTMTIINGNPTLNPTVVDTNSTTVALTGDNTKLIKYFSNVQWAHNAAAVKKASISQYIMSNGGTSYNTPSGTINGVQNNSFAFTVKDSRGNVTSQSLTRTMINYVKLTADLSVKMTVTGEATLICTGNYFDGSFGSQSNTLTFRYRYKELNGSYGDWVTATPSKSGNTYSISPTISGLDYRKKYIFQFNVVDKLMNINSAEISARALPVFDWSEEDFNFNVPVTSTANISAVNLSGSWEGYANDLSNTMSNPTEMLVLNGTNIQKATINYNNLSNKPSINGVVLEGNKTSKDLGIDILTDNQVLWGPGYYYMTANHTINLSQKVSEQKNGIVLVWQAYVDGQPQFYDFNYTFVPKHHTLVFPGRGISCFLSNSTGVKIGTKYVYVHDDKIEGNNVNDDGTTNRGSGITTTNNYWVLTYVIGV